MAENLKKTWKLNIPQPSTALPLTAHTVNIAELRSHSTTQQAQREAPLLWLENQPELIIDKPKWQSDKHNFYRFAFKGRMQLWNWDAFLCGPFQHSSSGRKAASSFSSAHSLTEGVPSHPVLLRNGTAVALSDRDRKELDVSLLSVLWRFPVTEHNPLQGQLLSW